MIVMLLVVVITILVFIFVIGRDETEPGTLSLSLSLSLFANQPAQDTPTEPTLSPIPKASQHPTLDPTPSVTAAAAAPTTEESALIRLIQSRIPSISFDNSTSPQRLAWIGCLQTRTLLHSRITVLFNAFLWQCSIMPQIAQQVGPIGPSTATTATVHRHGSHPRWNVNGEDVKEENAMRNVHVTRLSTA